MTENPTVPNEPRHDEAGHDETGHDAPSHDEPSHDEVAHLEADETVPPRPEEEIADVARSVPDPQGHGGTPGPGLEVEEPSARPLD